MDRPRQSSPDRNSSSIQQMVLDPDHEGHERPAQPQTSPQQVSKRNRVRVLVSCAVLQLPIWGFAMTYGIFQEYYLDHWTFDGSQGSLGLVGMISNGVMYLSMPVLFALLARRWAHYRRWSAVAGIVLAGLGFLASSFSTNVWHLVATQGVLVAFGCVLVYSPTTLALSEHFSSKDRALAYAAVLSSKNITGATCPFLVQFLLERLGFRTTIRIWAGMVVATSSVALFFMPVRPSGSGVAASHRPRRAPYDFLRHGPVYIYAIAIIFQSSGYGIAQTYLSSYANSSAALSATSSTLLLTLFNTPGILASAFFGLLSDNTKRPLSSEWTTLISALPAGLAALLFWGLAGASSHSLTLLILFAIVYGFFASGYSATWGGVIKEMEVDAATRNEAFDSGMVYGVLNGARGIGYVGGGLLAVQLLKLGSRDPTHTGSAYGTPFGPLIIYTGISTIFGGWSVAWKGQALLKGAAALANRSGLPRSLHA